MDDGKSDVMMCAECHRWCPLESSYLLPDMTDGRYFAVECAECVMASQVGSKPAHIAWGLKTVRELMDAAKGNYDG